MVGQIGGGLSTTSIIKNSITGNNNQIQKQDVETTLEMNKAEIKDLTKAQYSKEQVETVVDSMNDFLKASPNTHLKFEFHDQLNEYYVTIVDETTKEVVREIPPKKMLDIFAAMTEYLGLMVDKKI